jgi:hypothetical protein
LPEGFYEKIVGKVLWFNLIIFDPIDNCANENELLNET